MGDRHPFELVGMVHLPPLPGSPRAQLGIDAIVDDRPLTPSFYDGWKVQQAIEAAFAAHEQGCWITIPRDGPTDQQHPTESRRTSA